MSTLLQESNNDNSGKGSNKLLWVGLGIGLIVVLAAVALVSLSPSATQVDQQVLEGAFREGSPEFETYTKKVVARTNEDQTTKSGTAVGTIVMSISGAIRNITGKTLTGLELKVTVVDLAGTPLKEKTVIVIPRQQERLENNQSMPVRVNIEGFESDANIANIRWKVTAIKVDENGQ